MRKPPAYPWPAADHREPAGLLGDQRHHDDGYLLAEQCDQGHRGLHAGRRAPAAPRPSTGTDRRVDLRGRWIIAVVVLVRGSAFLTVAVTSRCPLSDGTSAAVSSTLHGSTGHLLTSALPPGGALGDRDGRRAGLWARVAFHRRLGRAGLPDRARCSSRRGSSRASWRPPHPLQLALAQRGHPPGGPGRRSGPGRWQVASCRRWAWSSGPGRVDAALDHFDQRARRRSPSGSRGATCPSPPSRRSPYRRPRRRHDHRRPRRRHRRADRGAGPRLVPAVRGVPGDRIAALLAFPVVERRAPRPLIPLTLPLRAVQRRQHRDAVGLCRPGRRLPARVAAAAVHRLLALGAGSPSCVHGDHAPALRPDRASTSRTGPRPP